MNQGFRLRSSNIVQKKLPLFCVYVFEYVEYMAPDIKSVTIHIWFSLACTCLQLQEFVFVQAAPQLTPSQNIRTNKRSHVST